MIAVDFGLAGLQDEFWRVIFLMTRLGAALLAAPFFGAVSVPMTARVVLTGALAVFVSVWLPQVATPPALLSAAGLLALAGEVLVGLTLGFVLQLAFAAPVIAAELVAGGMGMGMAMTGDPASGGSTTAFGQYFLIVLTLVFLATGAHLHWIALLAHSYEAFPPGQTWLGAARLAQVAGFAGQMFEAALRISLPVTLFLLVVQFVTGVLSRSAPALNLFALGLPAGVLAGLAALIVSAPLLFEQFGELSESALDHAATVLLR